MIRLSSSYFFFSLCVCNTIGVHSSPADFGSRDDSGAADVHFLQGGAEDDPSVQTAKDVAKVRLLHQQYLADLNTKALSWLGQELRQMFRRRAFTQEVTRTTKKYLTWVQYEGSQVDDLLR